MLRTYRRQEIDRIPMNDSAWAGTKRRWYNEGMPKDVSWEDMIIIVKNWKAMIDNQENI